MYFPYLRCKQFELLALRELAQELGRSDKLSPVLEPVKKSLNALEKALEGLMSVGVNFTLILNPIFGDFTNNNGLLIDFVNRKLGDYNNFQFGLIINQFTNIEQLDYILARVNFERPLSLIHAARSNDVDALSDWAGAQDIRYNLFNENIPARRYRGVILPNTKILLDDKFIPKAKNADYSDQPELFTDEHLYFVEDGYNGFGDYLTIGNDYTETGFLPYAVAIHLTYIRADRNNEIWIRHFVSDSNSDNSDVAGKFGEALEKLIAFINAEGINTAAADEFRGHATNGHYPGLGSLKKLSIKNHLELLIQLL